MGICHCVSFGGPSGLPRKRLNQWILSSTAIKGPPRTTFPFLACPSARPAVSGEPPARSSLCFMKFNRKRKFVLHGVDLELQKEKGNLHKYAYAILKTRTAPCIETFSPYYYTDNNRSFVSGPSPFLIRQTIFFLSLRPTARAGTR